MNPDRSDATRVSHTLGALPILILLCALFVAVAWSIEPLRFHIMRATVDTHPSIAERALSDESERIVMLGCNALPDTRRVELADRWLRSRPQLERSCVSDVYQRRTAR